MPVILRAVERRQVMRVRGGYRVWEEIATLRRWEARRTALVLCDVWDRHTCRGADERLARLLPGIIEVVSRLRAAGVTIVHAPSNTMEFYRGTPGFDRVARIAVTEANTPVERRPRTEDPPLPIDATDPCDTIASAEYPVHTRGMPFPWTRQHPSVLIDHSCDAITDDGLALWRYFHAQGITQVLIAGVHTNMCILNRSFAIKQLVRWGVAPILLRDLTDCMYNPASPPYVSHEAATALVVGYIERFWCGTTTSTHIATTSR